MLHNIVKRQFTAKNYPQGSVERANLNADVTTSEYMPSHKFAKLTWAEDGRPIGSSSYRTRKDAQASIKHETN